MTRPDHAAPSTTMDRLLTDEQVVGDDALVKAMATGFDPLDSVLDGGFLPEELILLGGRPGVGKTIAIVQWSRFLAREGHPVLIAQYEHSELSLLAHLCLMEVGEAHEPTETLDARRLLVDVAGRRIGWNRACASNPMLSDAADRVAAYAPNLSVLTLDGQTGGFAQLERAIDDMAPDLVMVDHLAKVQPERTELASTADRLKRLAVDQQITVLASTVVDASGIDVRRLRMAHLEAAAAIGHEADLVLMANDKLSAVSRSHSAFDSTIVHGMRNQLLLTLEKNRRGAGGIDLEFTRDYAHRRLDPVGGFVTELLVDDLLVRE